MQLALMCLVTLAKKSIVNAEDDRPNSAKPQSRPLHLKFNLPASVAWCDESIRKRLEAIYAKYRK
jgi:hypothetical protein